MACNPTWTSPSGHINVDHNREVAVITLNRPEKLNALSYVMRGELAGAVTRFGSAGDEVRGIVVTGAGRAFSAGEDLHDAFHAPPGSTGMALKLFNDLTRAVLASKVPVVGALNGIAVGGAAEWTFCFDARIGSQTCEYYFPENRLGLPISNASSMLLPRLVGSRAIDLLLSGRRVDSNEALRIGLIDEIADAPELVDTAVRKVLSWTDGGKLTAVHLDLLRPRTADVEAAIAREVRAASEAEMHGFEITDKHVRKSR